VFAKKQGARVSQYGRFEGDIEFWKLRLGETGRVIDTGNGRKLRFYLFDEPSFGTEDETDEAGQASWPEALNAVGREVL
jgi:hypothetical protein